ncbi:MAG: hypothetical protein PXY39_12945 [archaeon]|nr:hypothetical protein [archaeon]
MYASPSYYSPIYPTESSKTTSSTTTSAITTTGANPLSNTYQQQQQRAVAQQRASAAAQALRAQEIAARENLAPVPFLQYQQQRREQQQRQELLDQLTVSRPAPAYNPVSRVVSPARVAPASVPALSNSRMVSAYENQSRFNRETNSAITPQNGYLKPLSPTQTVSQPTVKVLGPAPAPTSASAPVATRKAYATAGRGYNPNLVSGSPVGSIVGDLSTISKDVQNGFENYVQKPVANTASFLNKQGQSNISRGYSSRNFAQYELGVAQDWAAGFAQSLAFGLGKVGKVNTNPYSALGFIGGEGAQLIGAGQGYSALRGAAGLGAESALAGRSLLAARTAFGAASFGGASAGLAYLNRSNPSQILESGLIGTGLGAGAELGAEFLPKIASRVDSKFDISGRIDNLKYKLGDYPYRLGLRTPKVEGEGEFEQLTSASASAPASAPKPSKLYDREFNVDRTVPIRKNLSPSNRGWENASDFFENVDRIAPRYTESAPSREGTVTVQRVREADNLLQNAPPLKGYETGVQENPLWSNQGESLDDQVAHAKENIRGMSKRNLFVAPPRFTPTLGGKQPTASASKQRNPDLITPLTTPYQTQTPNVDTSTVPTSSTSTTPKPSTDIFTVPSLDYAYAQDQQALQDQANGSQFAPFPLFFAPGQQTPTRKNYTRKQYGQGLNRNTLNLNPFGLGNRKSKSKQKSTKIPDYKRLLFGCSFLPS